MHFKFMHITSLYSSTLITRYVMCGIGHH